MEDWRKKISPNRLFVKLWLFEIKSKKICKKFSLERQVQSFIFIDFQGGGGKWWFLNQIVLFIKFTLSLELFIVFVGRKEFPATPPDP